MDSQHAKEILRLYRPGGVDAADPGFSEALLQVERDPELRRWFEAHRAFQTVVGEQLRRIEGPPGLKERILAEPAHKRKITWWRKPAWIRAAAAAAAGVILLAALNPSRLLRSGKESFSAFRDRMVRMALREYRVDLLTENLSEIRQFLIQRRSHGDYVLPGGLEKVRGHGCAVLHWNGQRVSMICFQRAEQDDLYLFIIDRSALSDAPSSTQPSIIQVNKLVTASWTVGGKVYVLAAAGNEESLKRYL